MNLRPHYDKTNVQHSPYIKKWYADSKIALTRMSEINTSKNYAFDIKNTALVVIQIRISPDVFWINDSSQFIHAKLIQLVSFLYWTIDLNAKNYEHTKED